MYNKCTINCKLIHTCKELLLFIHLPNSNPFLLCLDCTRLGIIKMHETSPIVYWKYQWCNEVTIGIYPKESKAETQTHTCMPVFIAALFSRAQRWKPHKCPSRDEWIIKKWNVHTVEYNSARKTNGVLIYR